MLQDITPLRGQATREERPATELKLGTYALTWQQHELSIASVPIAPNVLVMGVLPAVTAEDPRLEAGTLCSVMVVGPAGN